MTRLALSCLLVGSLFASACSKTRAPREAFKGTLTPKLILEAKNLVEPFDPWDEAFELLQHKLGKPTRIKPGSSGSEHYQWAALEGDACTYFEVEKESGEKYDKRKGMIVGTVQSPATYDKQGALFNRAECMEILGKTGTPEDPNAPPPPANGIATPELVVENAVKGRSKWVGKKLTVSTTLNGIGGMALTLGEAGLVCILPDNAPPDLQLGKEIMVEGTVKIQTMVSGGGDVSLRAELNPCAIVK